MELPGTGTRSERGIDPRLLVSAYSESREGYSSDRVVVDPRINSAFIASCRSLGLEQPEFELNHALFNARKANLLKGMPRSRRSRIPGDIDEWAFASEIAIRYLERKCGGSSDRILCDPALAQEFDAVAERLSPGFAPLQYRWAVLWLRKTRRLKPELVGKAIKPTGVLQHRTDTLSTLDLPTAGGIYIFIAPGETSPLYIGESANLRRRIAKHLDHSDNKGLARWLWSSGSSALSVEVHELAPEVTAEARRAYEADLIRSRRPIFNVLGIELSH